MTDETNPAPENQDTPEKLYGGKYKSPEELEQAYAESVRQQSQLAEENDRMQRYISLMDQPASTDPAPAPNGNGADLDEDVPEPVKKFVTRSIQQATIAVSSASAAEKAYFDKFPEHRGMEKLVLLEGQMFNAENPGRRVSLEKRIEEIGRRVQIQIDTIRRGEKAPPHVEGGTRSGRQVPQTGPERKETEEERLSSFIEESRKRRNKQLNKG